MVSPSSWASSSRSIRSTSGMTLYRYWDSSGCGDKDAAVMKDDVLLV
jgi:hypothetical protein